MKRITFLSTCLIFMTAMGIAQDQHFSFSVFDLKDPLDGINIDWISNVAVPSAYGIQVTGHSRGNLYLPVHLPDGAVIQQVRVYYMDNHSGAEAQVQGTLITRQHGGGDSSGSPLFTSSGSNPSLRMANISPDIAPIDNLRNHYYIDFRCSRHHHTLGISSGVITYGVP